MAPLTRTDFNRRAAAYLKKAREDYGDRVRGQEFDRKEFAALLARRLGTKLTAGMYRTYEGRTRHVPAAVMLAAAELTEIPIALERTTEDALVERVLQRIQEGGGKSPV